MEQMKTAQSEMTAQNDIADVLLKLAEIMEKLDLGTGLVETIRKIAQWFEDLSQKSPQAYAQITATPCVQQFIESVKKDTLEAAAMLLSKIPIHLQSLISCQFGVASSRGFKAQAEIDYAKLISCGFTAFMLYMQTKDVGAAIGQFLSCMFGGGGGTGGGGTTPSDQPVFRPVDRC